MSALNFDFEFDRVLFRGNEADIQALYKANRSDCTNDPTQLADGMWEVEVGWADVPALLKKYPLLKAAGFVLNWNERRVCVFYSRSGSGEVDRVTSVGPFDGHADAEMRWYAECPITAKYHSCKEYFSNVGEYDRFTYSFPYADVWEKEEYAVHVLSEQDRLFQIDPDGVLLNCFSKEEEIQVPYGVTVIGEKAFVEQKFMGSNKTLKKLILPESVREIRKDGLSGCQTLEEVILPEGLEVIGEGAFSITGLKEITLPMSLKEISPAAFGFSSIRKVFVPESHPVFEMKDDCLYNKQTRTLLRCFSDGFSVTVPEGVEALGERSFADLRTLTEISLPSTLRRIGAGAFSACRNLWSVVIPNGVTELEHSVFEYCNALSSVTLPDHLTGIGYSAFSYCEKLDHLVIPEGVTKIHSFTFSNCVSLEHITFPSTLAEIDDFKLGGLEETPWYKHNRGNSTFMAGGLILKCKGNPEVLEIPEGTKAIYNEVFAKNPRLRKVIFPEGLIRINRDAFRGCTALEEAVLPDSVTEIPYGAFTECAALTYLFARNASAGSVPMAGKVFHEDLIAVVPNLKLAEQKPAAWKMALCRGFVLNPELQPEELREENLAEVLKQRKKLLAWAFAKDREDVVRFFIQQVPPTKAKLKSEYLTPAQTAGAEKCLAYLASVTL